MGTQGARTHLKGQRNRDSVNKHGGLIMLPLKRGLNDEESISCFLSQL